MKKIKKLSKKKEGSLQRKTTPKSLKPKSKVNQKKLFYQYLYENIATVAMISKTIDIPEKNLCRYKRQLEKKGLLFKVYRGLCKRTGFKSFYITTNKELKHNYISNIKFSFNG